MSAYGDILWQPSPARIAQAQMRRFTDYARMGALLVLLVVLTEAIVLSIRFN